MTSLVQFTPRTTLDLFRRDPFFGRFFEGFLDEGTESAHAWMPAMDLIDEDDALLVNLEIPGIDPKEIEVNLQGDVLTVRGERKSEYEENKGKWLRREQVYGSFQRSVKLPYPVEADKVKAKTHNGVMSIRLPKAQEVIGRRIPVE